MNAETNKTFLIVEDNPGDARLLREMLRELSLGDSRLVFAVTLAEAERHVAEHSADAVLLDLGLPDAQGLQAVYRMHSAAAELPIVVLTGTDDEDLASRALQAGAQDYLIKGQIDPRGLMRALRYAIERKRMQEEARSMAQQIARAAQHDFLTDLPNRLLLNDRVAHAIHLAQRHDKKLAILFLDLDGFKHINDSLGHTIGDRLLQSVATRLVSSVRKTDTVSRQGGDEFVVLLSEIEHAEDAAISAQRMLQLVAQPHSIDQHDLHVTASIGVTIYPDDGEDAEALIKNADTAMYQAKAMGRQTYRYFEPVMNARAVERQSIEADLRRALERQELALCYQPKVDLATGAIAGVEALVRWRHETRGWVPPGQFIPVAEDCRLILPIGDWILGEACRQAQVWIAAGVPFGTMAVNVSALQLRDARFEERVLDVLDGVGLDRNLLELEVTESVLMTGAAYSASTLQALRDHGIRISLDDFGTGYSSLSYLPKFPVDCLKIDQTFVRRSCTDAGEVAVVTAIIEMGHALGLRVVAEGVETSDELEFLKKRRCDEAQGYYFSRPLDPDALVALLGRQRTIHFPAGCPLHADEIA